jgi:adenylate kinase
MLNIIIFGPPGAGKGTQAQLIAEKYGQKHLSSGEILRTERKKSESLNEEIKKYQDKGELVPDQIINELMQNEIRQNFTKAGFILDGYPRTIEQAKELDKFLSQENNRINLVLEISLTEEESIARIIERAKTSGRSDDNPEVIKDRCRIYEEESTPIIEYYRQQEKLVKIDGQATVNEVFAAACREIDKKIL